MSLSAWKGKYYQETAIVLFLVISVLVVYFQTSGFGFVYYDDPKYVRDNPFVMQGFSWDSIRWAFTSLGYASNWHPLTWLSHMLDVQIYGPAPGMHHLTNVILHILNSILLFYLFFRITGERWKCAAVAALFALHPLHVESVAWIAERKDVLSTLFWLMTMLGYTWYVERRTTARLSLLILVYALGLMAKPMLVTLPFALLLLDFWPLRREELLDDMHGSPDRKTGGRSPDIRWQGIWTLVKEKLPLFALAMISSYITFLAQKSGGSVTGSDTLPLMTRAANALAAYAGYLWHMIWPAHLAVFYPYPESISILQIAGSFLLLVCITLFAVIAVRRFPYLLTGWLWYLGTLVPVIGLVQVGNQSMADRYTYIPLIGIFIMLVWGVSELSVRWSPAKYALGVSFIAVVLVLMWISRIQTGYWLDSTTLFTHAIDVTRGNYLAHANLSADLLDKGDVPGAMLHAREALKIKPCYAPAQCNLGLILIKQGDYTAAADHLRKALQTNPGFVNAHYYLGISLYELGKTEESIREFRETLRLNPQHLGASKGIETVSMEQQKMENAIAGITEALKTEPGNPILHYKLAVLYDKKGNTGEAIRHYEIFLSLRPDSAKALSALGILYARDGKNDLAASSFKKMAVLEPDNPDIFYNLACIYSRQGMIDEGLKYLDQAVGKGFRNIDLLKSDPDLANLRNTESYRKLIQKGL